MGVNDAKEQLEVAKAECVRLEAEVERLQAVAILMDKVEAEQHHDIDGDISIVPWAKEIVRAVHRIEPGKVLREVCAKAWDEGCRAKDREWSETFDIVTADEDRYVATNPYREGQA